MRRPEEPLLDSHHDVAGLGERRGARVDEQPAALHERRIHLALIGTEGADADHVRAGLDPLALHDRFGRGGREHDEIRAAHRLLDRVDADHARLRGRFHLVDERGLVIDRRAPDADLGQLEHVIQRQQMAPRLRARSDDRHHRGVVSREQAGRHRRDRRGARLRDRASAEHREQRARLGAEEEHRRQMRRQIERRVAVEDRDDLRAEGRGLPHGGGHHRHELPSAGDRHDGPHRLFHLA
jgi:hypothetical protein